MVTMSLKERVYVKCRHGRELKGKLIAYDAHLNLMLGDVEEKIITLELDPLTKQEIPRIKVKNHSLLFLRGDLVVMVSPTP